MRAFFVAILAGAVLAGCSSTPTSEQPAAGVEDRTPGQQTRPGVDTSAVGQKPPSGIDLTTRKPGVNPLQVPGSILARRSVFFDFDKYDVKDEYKALLEAHGQYLRGNAGAKMLIQGNTDERGGREYNLALGQRRADAMKKMLMLLGAREDQIESVSLGEEKPRAQGSSEEAYAQNRRGDILYNGEY
jgi:peptidoglycan-associated lipoprotein